MEQNTKMTNNSEKLVETLAPPPQYPPRRVDNAAEPLMPVAASGVPRPRFESFDVTHSSTDYSVSFSREVLNSET